MQLEPSKTVFQEKPVGKVGKKKNKISHQNDTLVCYQHLSSYQCKAQHNWKERIFLGANKNTNNKFFFLCVLDIE